MLKLPIYYYSYIIAACIKLEGMQMLTLCQESLKYRCVFLFACFFYRIEHRLPDKKKCVIY